MANFKTHISVGIILGVCCAFFALLSKILQDWDNLSLVILFITIGSFLPDVDSDSSLPFKIVFYFLGIITAFFSLAWLMLNSNRILNLIFIPLGIFFIIRFMFGYIFKKFTRHRGIFHSIPMAIISILSSLILLNKFSNFSYSINFLLSVSIGIGFISHLILDEIYAFTNFNGKKFHPNKNLGTALKLWSKSKGVTFITYFIIIILILIIF